MTLSLRQSVSQVLSLTAVVAACLLGIGLLQRPQLQALKNSDENATLAELQQQDAAESAQLELLQKLPTLGFDNLVADWVFLNFLQYFGDTPARNQTGYSLSPDYFEAILDRDPYYIDFYFFLSASSSLYAGLPDRSVDLMNEKLQMLSPTRPPQSYFIWRYKGIDELLFLGDSTAARQSFENAADWASIYSDPQSQAIEQVSRQTADFLTRNPDSRTAQISTWAMVLTNAFDQTTQELAISQIQALGGNVSVDDQGRLRVSYPSED